MLLLVISLGAAASVREEFAVWKAAHGRVYATADEEAYRFSIFEENLEAAAAQQALEKAGGARFGPNEFSDWTTAEFKQRLLGSVPVNALEELPHQPKLKGINAVPGAIDWTGAATTPVKNQGHCGSCWAFSATEQIESDFILQKNATLVLAPQELVDCRGDGSERDGCHGGNPTAAYKVIEEIGGMELETDYPYDGKNDKCTFKQSKAKITLGNSTTGKPYYVVGKRDEAEMKKYVGAKGPLSVCVNATSWHHYQGGVMTACADRRTDHCVQLVGYGHDTDSGLDYWKLRNSWGAKWGETGFLRVEFGKDSCDVSSIPTRTIPGEIIKAPTIEAK